MILSSLQVSGFGALVSVSIDLEPRMNILVGPNEAGKSTLFKALQHLLLTPVHLNKHDFQELIQPLLPVGGGDTVSAALEFRIGDQPYRLEKSWGADCAAQLRMPDGTRISKAEAVEARLLELLPVQPGTLRSVLLSYQSGLAATIGELGEETVYGLSDLLHRSVLETDGVSVGRFQELLDRRCEEHLWHWDLERRRPERKKGGDPRWSQKRGTVLEAYYAYEDAERRHREISEKEADFGTLTGQLESITRELTGKENNLRSIEQAAKDAERRNALEVKLRETELSLKEVRKDYDSWTTGLLRLEALEGELPELERSLQAVEIENSRVQAYLQKKDQIARLERIRSKRERLDQAEAELKQLHPLPRSGLERLRESASEIDRLQASLQAGNLSLIFQTTEPIDLVTQKDMEAPAELHLSKGRKTTLQAAGKIEIRHPGWSLEVYSGEGAFKKVAEGYGQAQSRHRQLLREFQVSSVEKAAAASRLYEEKRDETQTAKAVYEQELGGDTFEALEAAWGGSREPSPPREQSQVVEDLVRTRSRHQSLRDEAEQIRQTLQNLSGQYSDKEALFIRIAELGGIRQRVVEQIAALVPLPEGYPDSRSLLDFFNGLRDEVEALKQRTIRLESDHRNAEESLPDESSEEAKGRVKDAQDKFDKELKKAEVLVRIKHAAEHLLAELDEGIYEPFTALVSRYLADLSDNRYRNVPSDAAIPAAVIRGDGRALPYTLLSAGTKDIFALALRLAMAEFFLSDGKGFLVLDDPLVDLDPQRQQRAAAVLAAFAAKHQLVVFTCQPAHAALFGEAQRVELERP